ncbi:MAG: hypothetical protein WAU91_20505 [Desulfatitalea sp.]
MGEENRICQGVISSDWNECLAPCGPFDCIRFFYPSLEGEINAIFKSYTGNEILFSEACRRIRSLLPAPLTEEQMDAYLDESFATYPGVPELIEWSLGKGLLFMINTTGPQGYFQRVFAKRLLPPIPVLSASTFIRFAGRKTDPPQVFDLMETQDKPKHTAAVLTHQGLPAGKSVLIGDSGGDGPHLEWGSKTGAYLIGSMTKGSLKRYCEQRKIGIDLLFGPSWEEGAARNQETEMKVNFMDLAPTLEAVLGL